MKVLTMQFVQSAVTSSFLAQMTGLALMHTYELCLEAVQQGGQENQFRENYVITTVISCWCNTHNIYQYFHSQPKHNLRTTLLCGNWFRP
jgi:hypothetical protein